MDHPKQPEVEQEQAAWIQKIQKTKSPLIKSLELQELSVEELQRMHALLELFTPTLLALKKRIRLIFMIAGFLWFPIFFTKAMSIPPEIIEPFRNNQTRLYLILMSLWGFIKHRTSGQYTTLLQLAAQTKSPWYTLQVEDVKRAGKLYTFEWLAKYEGSEKKYFHIILMWIFICAATIQVGRQLWLLFG